MEEVQNFINMVREFRHKVVDRQMNKFNRLVEKWEREVEEAKTSLGKPTSRGPNNNPEPGPDSPATKGQVMALTLSLSQRELQAAPRTSTLPLQSWAETWTLSQDIYR